MTPITLQQFLIVLAGCTATMAACRCIPLFLLKGRTLSPALEDALSLIPPAAFAALVANDLLAPGMLAEQGVAALVPIAAAAVVAVVAKKTGSLIWCALTGVAVYAVLALLV